ncbi:MAG: hypothetical protein M0P47_03520 [Bacteroidales bacterium]|nr:hypothetical protein [Bacteroidales bacterium]
MFPKSLFFFIFIYLFISEYSLKSQGLPDVQQAETELGRILMKLKLTNDDSVRSDLNTHFYCLLEKTIRQPESDTYPFDSLKSLVKITSPDKKFRLYQWDIPTSQGRYRYFAFIKTFDPLAPQIIPLTDFHDSIPFPDSARLDEQHWFGALYYTIIPCDSGMGKYYTLLGWAGQNALLTEKVIDVLYFDQQGLVHFGCSVFPDFNHGTNTRVIFRYSASTSMTLKFLKSMNSVEKKGNKVKNVILFDQLIPMDPQLKNQHQFYVPSGDVADLFIFENHHWHFISGIEAKNSK